MACGGVQVTLVGDHLGPGERPRLGAANEERKQSYLEVPRVAEGDWA